MKHLRLQVALSGLLALSLLPLQAIEAAGAKVLQIDGVATKTSLDGTEVAISAGDILTEGDELTVGALSQVDLVFSNGSTMSVREKSNLEIETLQQEEFTGDKSYEQLEADPSKSQTRLQLKYGIVDGHVKKLQKGSSFDVVTPLGTAGIRGTQFSCALVYNSSTGQLTLSVTNLDGAVDFIGQFANTPSFNKNGVAKTDFSGDAKKQSIPMARGSTIQFSISKNDPNFNSVVKAFNINPKELSTQTELGNRVMNANEVEQLTPPGTEISPSGASQKKQED